MRKKKPNPLEILGISGLIVRRLEHNPRVLLSYIAAIERAWTKHFHPDISQDPEESKLAGWMNAAFDEVDTPEKLAIAVKDYLSGGEQFDRVFEIQHLQGDLKMLKTELRKAQTQKDRAKQELAETKKRSIRMTKLMIERAYPLAADPDKFHLSQAANSVLVLDRSERDYPFKRAALVYIDQDLSVLVLFLVQKKPETIAAKIQTEIAQLKKAQKPPIPSPLDLWESRGFLAGSAEHPFSQESVFVRDFWQVGEQISPYLETGKQIISLSRHTFGKRKKVVWEDVNIWSLGCLREIIPLSNPVPN